MSSAFEATGYFQLLSTLDEASRRELDAAAKPFVVAAHEVIYEQGSEAAAVYIVASGVVEVVTTSPDGRQSRSVAFLGKGEFFGELGVLTDNTRIATVTACEASQVLRIDRHLFLRLIDKMPRLGAFFTRTLARRLYSTTLEAHRNVYAVDLAGNLEHFDLLTIFQAITGMGASGELSLKDTGNNLIGSFFFRRGRAEDARFMHLAGIEAIWQGFLEAATRGTFSFCVHDEPTLTYAPEHRIDLDSTDLLMQGATRRDSYQALPEALRRMDGRLCHRGEELKWDQPETQLLAAHIWELVVKRPQPLASLWRRHNYSVLTFLETVDRMIATGQAELAPDEPPAASG